MHIDERSKKILFTILAQPESSNKDLQEQYRLSRRQIDYSIKKLNGWLSNCNYPQILRSSQGRFIINPKLYQVFQQEPLHELKHVSWYVPFEKERAYLLIVMLATRNVDFSLNLFVEELEVSKNTVLTDMKCAQEILKKFTVTLKYSRIYGYYLAGDEWSIRSSMIFAIQEVISEFDGERELQHFMAFEASKLDELKEKLQLVEFRIGSLFIDKQVIILPYIFESTFRRIKFGHRLNQKFLIDYEAISDTKEFEATNLLVSDTASIPKEDKLYIALHLLTSNVLLKEGTAVVEEPRFRNALIDFLDLFESKACIQLGDKETLLEKLYNHFKPAYYRMKYGLTIDYRILEKIDHDFDYLHSFVKESVAPLEELIGKQVPDHESIFFTLLISAHIIKVADIGFYRVKAIVVCPNGLSISRLMEQELRNLLPEVSFYKGMSVREFTRTTLPYDLVFAPVLLKTEKKFFLVDQIITEKSGQKLRQRVMDQMYNRDNHNLSMTKILEIIAKNSFIHNKQQLTKDLTQLLSQPMHSPRTPPLEEVAPEHKKTLADLLPEKYIQSIETVTDWQAGLVIACQPLLKNSLIEPSYLEALKKQYQKPARYIILRNRIAIPHAESHYGVNQLGMSLLVVKEGIPFDSGIKFHLIVVLAAMDKVAHFKALLELVELAANENLVERMITQDVPQLSQSIQAFSKSLRENKNDIR